MERTIRARVVKENINFTLFHAASVLSCSRLARAREGEREGDCNLDVPHGGVMIAGLHRRGAGGGDGK